MMTRIMLIKLGKLLKGIKGIVMNAAVEILGYEERPERNNWFDNECETMIRSKNQAYKADQPMLKE
jgi:hypothetical protein